MLGIIPIAILIWLGHSYSSPVVLAQIWGEPFAGASGEPGGHPTGFSESTPLLKLFGEKHLLNCTASGAAACFLKIAML